MTMFLTKAMQATLQARLPLKRMGTTRFLHGFEDIKPTGTMTKIICTLGPSTDTKEMVDKRE